MTCAEFRKLVEGSIGKGGPFAVTRAERTAGMAHCRSCRSCDQWVTANSKKAAETAGDLYPAIHAIADAEVQRLIDSDVRDAEV